MEKKYNILLLVLLPILTFGLGIATGVNTQGQSFDNLVNQVTTTPTSTGQTLEEDALRNNAPEALKNFSTFWEVWNRIRTVHPDGEELSEKDMLYGAVKGLANSVGDPYTYFLDPEESKEFLNVDLNGELQGIGAELQEGENGELIVADTLPGSPAESAGVMPGDIITNVDGKDIVGQNIFEVVKKIRGPRDSHVGITVLRKDELTPLNFDIVRADIKVPSVSMEERENGKLAYIRIQKFANSTGDELKQTVQQLLLKRPKAIVLDLRNNSGGFLTAAVEVLSQFISEGKVLSVESTTSLLPQEYSVDGTAKLADVPMVVLINKQSASASEIVAGALQDLGRATVIGTASFGKGSVQELQDLPDGSSLRITIAKWFTPNGFNVETKVDGEPGIHPDILIENTTQDLKDGKDPQYEKAVEELIK